MLGDNSYTKISRGHPFQIKELFEFKALNENNIYVVKNEAATCFKSKNKENRMLCSILQFSEKFQFLTNFTSRLAPVNTN